MKSRLVTSGVITLVAAAAYCGMRAMPDTSCSFLHVHDKPVAADGIEYCAPDEVGMFAALGSIKFPVTAKIESEEPLRVGETGRVRLRLYGPGGGMMYPASLAFSHTKRVHVMAADPTLDAYRHFHPEPDGESGDWVFEYTPLSGGEHVFFIDCVHAVTKRQQLIRVTLPVDGATLPAEPLRGKLATTPEGVTCELVVTPEHPEAGQIFDLALRFRGKDGAPVSLKPVMAAYAHMIALDPERDGFGHMHPMESPTERSAAPELKFRFRADKPGRYRLWAQFDAGDGERYLPYDITVR